MQHFREKLPENREVFLLQKNLRQLFKVTATSYDRRAILWRKKVVPQYCRNLLLRVSSPLAGIKGREGEVRGLFPYLFVDVPLFACTVLCRWTKLTTYSEYASMTYSLTLQLLQSFGEHKQIVMHGIK